jgi:serine/threonine-protein kinase
MYESGHLVRSRFIIENCLYEGSICRIYLAQDELLNRKVTIKHILKSENSSAEAVHDAVREAELLATLSHPNIISLYDVYQDDLGFGLIMPFKPFHLGTLKRETIFGNVPYLIRLLKQIAAALDYMAISAVAHGDVKPENILVDVDGNAHIIDLGLAIKHNTAIPPAAVRGTYPYIPPEALLKDDGDINRRELLRFYDQFSLGVSIFSTLAGALPFQHLKREENPLTASTAFHLLRREPLLSCSDLDSRIPRGVDVVLSRMLNVNPAERYTTNSDAVDDLERALESKLLSRHKPFLSYARPDQDVATQLYSRLSALGLVP